MSDLSEKEFREILSHEQETELRIMFRDVHKEKGPAALWRIMAEMACSMKVLNDIIHETKENKDD